MRIFVIASLLCMVFNSTGLAEESTKNKKEENKPSKQTENKKEKSEQVEIKKEENTQIENKEEKSKQTEIKKEDSKQVEIKKEETEKEETKKEESKQEENNCKYEYAKFQMTGTVERGRALPNYDHNQLAILAVVRVASNSEGMPKSIVVKSTYNYAEPDLLPVTKLELKKEGSISKLIGRHNETQTLSVELRNKEGSHIAEMRTFSMSKSKYNLYWIHTPANLGPPPNHFKRLDLRFKGRGRVFLFRYSEEFEIGEKHFQLSSAQVQKQFFFAETRSPDDCK